MWVDAGSDRRPVTAARRLGRLNGERPGKRGRQGRKSGQGIARRRCEGKHGGVQAAWCSDEESLRLSAMLKRPVSWVVAATGEAGKTREGDAGYVAQSEGFGGFVEISSGTNSAPRQSETTVAQLCSNVAKA